MMTPYDDPDELAAHLADDGLSGWGVCDSCEERRPDVVRCGCGRALCPWCDAQHWGCLDVPALAEGE